MTEGKIRVGIVGLGWVAQSRHIPALLRNPAFSFVGTVDRREDRAAAVARAYGARFFAHTDNLADVPWLDEVDAIVIGAPPEAHARLALTALTRGKHVLTEKPFAMNGDEAEAMGRAAVAHGRVLGVIHNFQFSRAMRRFEKERASGALGQIRRVAAMQIGNPQRRLPLWHEDLPLGLFFDESPHFFYLLRRIAGRLELRAAHGAASSLGKQTPAFAHLFYRSEDGIPVTIDCQFEGALSEWFIRVSGDRATAFIDIFRDIYIRLPNDGTHALGDVLRTSLCAIGQHLAAHVPNGIAFLRERLDYGNDEVFARFARAIQNGTAPEGMGFVEALDVVQTQSQAIKALPMNLLS